MKKSFFEEQIIKILDDCRNGRTVKDVMLFVSKGDGSPGVEKPSHI